MAERADAYAPQPAVGEQALQIERRRLVCVHPRGREQRDWLVDQPPKRECQRAPGRRIEPLEVVDRDHDRIVLYHCSENAEERLADRTRIRQTVRSVVAKQSSIERAVLRRGQRRERIRREAAEEVGEAGEREPDLGAGSARRKNRHAAPA